ISVRGAPFEQTLVLLNGVRMNDPQTGHFTMDIPLTRLDVDRLDIVYGPSSAYYGSSGIGGTINILAKPPLEKPGVDIEFEGGQYDYFSGAISINAPVSVLKNKISFEASRSGGYRAETEFDKIIMNANSNLTFENGYIDFMFGYLRKDFGADSFYSQFYDNEEEHTDTRFFKLDASYRIDGIIFKPTIYYRRHWDKFILDRNRPDWYKNFHKNYLYGGEFEVIMKNPLGDLSYGMDLAREEIKSTSLGDHSRDRLAIFFENRTDFEKWFLDTSARIDYYSSFGWQFNPNLGIGIFINPEFKLRASAARSFRAPTFTDLYYVSPANVGNPDLTPEKAWSFDLGVDYIKDG
ncbi:MAG: TonB-dependent receptor, partial [Candidatus Heimdallarchaeota archaeon]|nr:TonB-dependent receptor [Candidatus Heimdallarchaeota archaeon]